ncbi:L,D-transpeptidase family protein [Oricola cellulosilytica]|uniref:Twin-arginine translocation signal domain-containing protein n=1 Tax=Oricola cellulosilytica TaxID=1429082 RepID=A0A4R0PFX0_9HYPH|nr:L,D-transpeptidase family protein [Oricola cellulosilytica]TCD14384.1 twin-arginine translocation signal domain-containing protein [Oricola cellulosilytica]
MNRSKQGSRRSFLKGAGALGATLAGLSQARAQDTLIEVLRSPRRGNWEDQFDAVGTRAPEVRSRQPILSPATVSYVEQAIATYRGIVAQGGWPHVNLTERLKVGSSTPAVRDLRRRLIVSGDLPRNSGDSPVYDTFLDEAVKRFQMRHGMTADGVIGDVTLAALNVPAPIRLGQLETNLVRLHSMSGFLGDRYVMVNIPGAEIEAVENGRVAQNHKAIVGKTDRQTPVLTSNVHEIILNPYWTAPKSIIEKDIIPLMRKDPTYLTRNSIRLFDGQGQEVPPEQVDWSTNEAVNLRFRQDPGKINAMASTKINFLNPHAVYLHDTPQQSLFGQLLRFESSGCVRVHNVRELTTWLLRDTPGWSRNQIEAVIASGENTEIPLSTPVPIYMVYVTAWSTGDGVVHFRDDIYRNDGVDELQLSSTSL